MNNNKGISLISLIITIIVIIILAAIVIFNGFGTTDSAEFAKFAQEFSGYQEEIDQRYLTAKTQSVLDGRRKKDSVIYSEMGSPAGTVYEVLDGIELQEPLKGTNCYLLTPDREIYDEDERIYVTDKGEVFTLPGYEYESNGETRWYVNSTQYYVGEGLVTPGGNEGGAPTIDGTIAVGHYVNYIPDRAEYTNNEIPSGKDGKDYYLGHTTAATIETDMNALWRVVRIEENGKILITPQYPLNNLKFYGMPGYQNSVRILDYVCGKLYSNNTLGTKARSIRVEDLDYTIADEGHYAYYNYDVEPQDIVVNGVTYIGETTWDDSYWSYDNGTSNDCIHEEEIDGYTYRFATPTGNKPVLVTENSYTLVPGEKTALAKTVIDGDAWFASTFSDYFGTHYRICFWYWNYVSGEVMNYYYSGSGLGMRPVITLGSGLKMATSETEDAGSIDNPWIISKVK